MFLLLATLAVEPTATDDGPHPVAVGRVSCPRHVRPVGTSRLGERPTDPVADEAAPSRPTMRARLSLGSPVGTMPAKVLCSRGDGVASVPGVVMVGRNIRSIAGGPPQETAVYIDGVRVFGALTSHIVP